MGLQNVVIFLLLVVTYCQCLANASTCEETETAHVKLDLAKQSIHSAKFLFPKCENETNGSNCSIKDKSLAHLNAALDLISEAKSMCHTCPDVIVTEEPEVTVTEEPEVTVTELPEVTTTSKPDVVLPHPKPQDCSEVLNNGFNKSDVYQIWPKGPGFFPYGFIRVYCDMDTDGGGWTVIQRRGSFKPQTDFYQDWETYRKGFGDIKQEFWLGNHNLHALSNQGMYKIRFDLQSIDGSKAFATYDRFWIEDEKYYYKLHIENYSGTAGDTMVENNMAKFSTKDRKNDKSPGEACSSQRHGGWWYSNCTKANLNGLYQPGKKSDLKSIYWTTWKDTDGLLATEIKIRKK